VARSRIWAILGSRSLRTATTGAATKTDEYAPRMSPTKRAKAKLWRVSPPKSINAPTGRRTTRLVFRDRISTWFRERLTVPE
jgi:hypothetical protein